MIILHTLRLTSRQFKELPEYSCSIPTGTTIGKRWKRLDGSFDREFIRKGGKPKWTVGEYMNAADPEHVVIRWYRPRIVMRAAMSHQPVTELDK